jgi:hypothetical protein
MRLVRAKMIKPAFIAVIVLMTAIPAFLTAQTSGTNFAEIRELIGTVEIREASSTAWKTARAGDKLVRSTIISTGFKSGAVLAIGNSTLTVRPLTRLSIEELTQLEGNETVGLSLQAGRVRAEVKPPESGKTDFSVRAPTVTASVRGTGFSFDTINLLVNDGIVAFTGERGGSALVDAGKGSFVSDGTPSAPLETPRSLVDALRQGDAGEDTLRTNNMTGNFPPPFASGPGGASGGGFAAAGGFSRFPTPDPIPDSGEAGVEINW